MKMEWILWLNLILNFGLLPLIAFLWRLSITTAELKMQTTHCAVETTRLTNQVTKIEVGLSTASDLATARQAENVDRFHNLRDQLQPIMNHLAVLEERSIRTRKTDDE